MNCTIWQVAGGILSARAGIILRIRATAKPQFGQVVLAVLSPRSILAIPKRVNGRLLSLGTVTFDTDVGFGRTTGVITHHIAATIDADRDKLPSDLTAAGWLSPTEGIDFQIKHVVQARPLSRGQYDGRNGGGDPYHTDGKLSLGILEGR